MHESSDPKYWFERAKKTSAGGAKAEEVAALYRKALALDPRYAEAWSNLGGVLGSLGRLEEEIGAYRRGIEANRSLAPIWSNLGHALLRAQAAAEAEQACRTALRLDARFTPAWVNLGSSLREQKRPQEALETFRQALQNEPDLPEAWFGLGNALCDIRDYGGAAEALARVCRVRPRMPEAHLNLGLALKYQGRYNDAEDSLRRALAVAPGFADAAWALALLLLARGRFKEGWPLYESRWRRTDAPARRFPHKGAPLREMPRRGRVLVWGEQGVGDELLYACMAEELAQGGVEVTLEADARLAPLFKRSLRGVRVVARSDPTGVSPDDFDVVVPAADMALWLRPSLESFSDRPLMFRADPQRKDAFLAVLERCCGNRRRVGIAWRSHHPGSGEGKSLALAQWAPIISVPGTSFIALQYGETAQERRALVEQCGIEVLHIEELDLSTDLDGVAALISACDLVITTSNVTAHLAGSLGRPVWILLPRGVARRWYWMEDRDRTPWYPSVRYFNQERTGDWNAAVQEVSAALSAWLSSGCVDPGEAVP